MARDKNKADSQQYKKVEDLPEDRRKAFHSILDDFNKQASEKIDVRESELIAMQNQIRSMFRVAKLKLHKSDRSSIFETLSDGPDLRLLVQLETAKSSVEAAFSSKDFNFKQKTPNSCASSVKRRGHKSITGSTATNRQSARNGTQKTPFGSDPKKTRSTAKSEKSEKALARVKQTPTNALSAGSRAVITPKFNLANPLTRTGLRNAKSNEMLVSLSGSPVFVGRTTTNTRGKKVDGSQVPIPLGKGKALMVSVDSPSLKEDLSQLDLDNDAKRRLLALRSQIDNMLQLRN